MKKKTLGFLAAALLGSHTVNASGEDTIPLIKTEVQLSGHCAKIFGRTRIQFDSPHVVQANLPVAPIVSLLGRDASKATCTLSLKYTDSKNSKPVAGLSVYSSRIVATTADFVGTKRIAVGRTDKNGEVRLKFPWDESSCGV